jgi:hypothetical protein
VKRFLLPLFLAACSSEAPALPLEDAGLEADAAEHEGAAGEGAEDSGPTDASLLGFGDSGQDAGQDQGQDAGQDAGETPDGASEELPIDTLVGTWNTEETQCWNLTETSSKVISIERLDPPSVGPKGTANYVFKPYALALYEEGDELVTRTTGANYRFWLVDQNTLGGSLEGACPEFVLTGTRAL